MTKAIIKSTKMFNFPYIVHVYRDGALQYGKSFSTLLGVQAYLISNNIDRFESML